MLLRRLASSSAGRYALRAASRPSLASSATSAAALFSTTARRSEILGEGTKDIFEEHVVKGQKLTVVDFHADWCPPCKMLDPILQKVMKDETQADYLKINTDNETELAAKYKISALPTVVAFKHGKEYCRFVGFVDESAVRNFLANAKEG